MSSRSIGVSSYFECPDCKCDYIEEIQTGVTMCTAMSDMHRLENGIVEVEYNQHEMEGTHWGDGGVDRYQCANCGWTIQDENGKVVTNPEDLFMWLVAHNWMRTN